jgi:hypothetical protein
MVQTLQIVSSIALLACVQLSHAFVVHRATPLVGPAVPLVVQRMHKQTTAIAMVRKTDDRTGTNEIDYGKIVGMLVNPLNPYSWCFYFIVGIYVFNAIK